MFHHNLDGLRQRQIHGKGKFVFLKYMLNLCETIPRLRVLAGVSMLKTYRKLPDSFS